MRKLGRCARAPTTANSQSAAPLSRNAVAVLTFIDACPRPTVFRRSISNAQPTTAATPTAAMVRAAALTMTIGRLDCAARNSPALALGSSIASLAASPVNAPANPQMTPRQTARRFPANPIQPCRSGCPRFRIHGRSSRPTIRRNRVLAVGFPGRRHSDPQAVRQAFPAQLMTAFPVSTRINTPKNDTPDLTESSPT